MIGRVRYSPSKVRSVHCKSLPQGNVHPKIDAETDRAIERRNLGSTIHPLSDASSVWRLRQNSLCLKRNESAADEGEPDLHVTQALSVANVPEALHSVLQTESSLTLSSRAFRTP